MVGIVVVTHGRLAEEFVKVAGDIVGQIRGVIAVSIGREEPVDNARKEIEAALNKVNDGDGVLMFTDMFGGTPSNLGLSFLEEGKTEVICGVNLPMLIKASVYREDKQLRELASFIKEYGERSISLASDILKMKAGKR